MKKFILAVFLFLMPTLAFAQAPTRICVQGSNNSCLDVSATNPFPISAGSTLNSNITQWNSVSLGSPTLPGVSPSGNLIGVNAVISNSLLGGSNYIGQVGASGTSSASAGITPTVTSAAGNNLVLKASAGNLYSTYATNQTATAGFLMVLNATAAPVDGAVTPLECVPLPASGNATINYNPGPPSVFSTGIVAVVSSGANCFTKTTGVITAFIKGSAL